jgi:hypothetical protein
MLSTNAGQGTRWADDLVSNLKHVNACGCRHIWMLFVKVNPKCFPHLDSRSVVESMPEPRVCLSGLCFLCSVRPIRSLFWVVYCYQLSTFYNFQNGSSMLVKESQVDY